MHKQRILAIVLATLLLQACAVTGPADDGFENAHESLSSGRLFSNDDGGYSIYSSQQEPAASDNTNARLDASDPNYQAFQQWRNAKESNSPDYQKFKLWQEFEAFQLWREQQKK